MLFLSVAAGACLAPPSLAAGEASGARQHFMLYCLGCHGANGAGSPGKGIPDLRDELPLFLSVEGGRAYLAQVPGALNTPLSDQDTAAALNWAVANISRTGAPPGFSPYTATEVAALRATVPDDILAERARLLSRVRGPVSPRALP